MYITLIHIYKNSIASSTCQVFCLNLDIMSVSNLRTIEGLNSYGFLFNPRYVGRFLSLFISDSQIGKILVVGA